MASANILPWQPDRSQGRTNSEIPLANLMNWLNRLSTDESQIPRFDPAVESWTDDKFIYLQAELSEQPSIDADVSIQDGRVFIRLARQEVAIYPTNGEVAAQ